MLNKRIKQKQMDQLLQPGILRPPTYDISTAPAIGPPPKEEGEQEAIAARREPEASGARREHEASTTSGTTSGAGDGGKDGMALGGQIKMSGHVPESMEMGEIPVHDT